MHSLEIRAVAENGFLVVEVEGGGAIDGLTEFEDASARSTGSLRSSVRPTIMSRSVR